MISRSRPTRVRSKRRSGRLAAPYSYSESTIAESLQKRRFATSGDYRHFNV